MKKAIHEKTKKHVRQFELLFLKHMRIVPSMIFVAVLLFGSKLIDLLTFQELREGKEGGLVAGEVAQPTAKLNAASLKNKEDGKQQSTEERKSDFPNVDVDKMTPQKYQLIKAVEDGNTLQSEGSDEKLAKTEALQAVEARVSKKITELSEAEKKIKASVDAKAQKDEEDRKVKLLRLIKIAEGLDPKGAATILEGVEFPILIELMSHIKESKASAILSKMAPEKASYLLSALGRKMEGNDLIDAGYHTEKAKAVEPKTVSIPNVEDPEPSEESLSKEDKLLDTPSRSTKESDQSSKESSSKANSNDNAQAPSKEAVKKTSVDNTKINHPKEKSAKKHSKQNDQKKVSDVPEISLELQKDSSSMTPKKES